MFDYLLQLGDGQVVIAEIVPWEDVLGIPKTQLEQLEGMMVMKLAVQSIPDTFEIKGLGLRRQSITR